MSPCPCVHQIVQALAFQRLHTLSVEEQALDRTLLTLKSEFCIPASHSGTPWLCTLWGYKAPGHALAELWPVWGEKKPLQHPFTMNPVFYFIPRN